MVGPSTPVPIRKRLAVMSAAACVFLVAITVAPFLSGKTDPRWIGVVMSVAGMFGSAFGFAWLILRIFRNRGRVVLGRRCRSTRPAVWLLSVWLAAILAHAFVAFFRSPRTGTGRATWEGPATGITWILAGGGLSVVLFIVAGWLSESHRRLFPEKPATPWYPWAWLACGVIFTAIPAVLIISGDVTKVDTPMSFLLVACVLSIVLAVRQFRMTSAIVRAGYPPRRARHQN